MSKQFFAIAGTLLLALSISAFSGSCTSAERPLFHLSTISPNKTYKVMLDEQAVISSDRLFTKHGHHEVRFTVTRDGRTILKRESLYSGGTYDDRFLDQFPTSEWLSDSVMRFGQTANVGNRDEVVVYNETADSLSYLVVRSGKYEVFLLIDLPPNSVVKLSPEPQTDEHGDSSYISASGKLNRGGLISETGRNFNVHGKYKGPAHYAIHIKDGALQITSEEFEAI
jgi:hypothetical protein